jgi:hypothetical protein
MHAVSRVGIRTILADALTCVHRHAVTLYLEFLKTYMKGVCLVCSLQASKAAYEGNTCLPLNIHLSGLPNVAYHVNSDSFHIIQAFKLYVGT